MKKNIQHVRSKFLKTAVLLKDNTLKQYVPETRLFSSDNLKGLLQDYKMVYVKPDRGRYGIGVMKVEMVPSLENSTFRLYFGRVSREYTSQEELLAVVKSMVARRAYIVQQGIQMLTHDTRPFDIRVMVQQSRLRQWKTTGFLARVAAPQRIVTNFHGGGTPQVLTPILSRYLTRSEATLYISRLCRLGERVARHCHRSFPGLKEVGLDVAIDRDMRAWILEVNTRPQADVFRELDDRTMYKRIYRYRRIYRIK